MSEIHAEYVAGSQAQMITTSHDYVRRLEQLPKRVAELEAALDEAKQRELIILGWLQEKEAWARAWKKKATHSRKSWKMEARKPWCRRCAWLELWESGR